MPATLFGISNPPLVDPARPGLQSITHRLLVATPTLWLALQFELAGADTTDDQLGPGRPPKAGFCCAVFGLPAAPDQPVVISALDIGVGRDWELRTSGLWTEQTCEQPFVHWSYGLEAFALAIDQPDELLRRGYGHRIPLGWELDFVAADEPPAIDDRGGHHGGRQVTQNGTVEGILLDAEGQTPLAGRALRAFWMADPPVVSHVDKLRHHERSRAATSEPAVVLPTMAGPWVVRRS